MIGMMKLCHILRLIGILLRSALQALAYICARKNDEKIFIPTPLDESIELPKDVTHHVLHVFRHNIENL